MKFLQKWTARFFETQCTAVVACGWFGPPSETGVPCTIGLLFPMMVVHHALHVLVWYSGGNSEHLVYKVAGLTTVREIWILHRYSLLHLSPLWYWDRTTIWKCLISYFPILPTPRAASLWKSNFLRTTRKLCKSQRECHRIALSTADCFST